MTTTVAQVSPIDTLEHAKSMMRFRGVHEIVVIDGRTVAGVLTMDQIGALPPDGLTVEDVMIRHVVTASPQLTLRKAASILRGSPAPALPVMERGRLVGIVTVADLLDRFGRAERIAARGRRS